MKHSMVNNIKCTCRAPFYSSVFTRKTEPFENQGTKEKYYTEITVAAWHQIVTQLHDMQHEQESLNTSATEPAW